MFKCIVQVADGVWELHVTFAVYNDILCDLVLGRIEMMVVDLQQI